MRNCEDITTFSYESLTSNEYLIDKIETAFGINGLGILSISNVPGLSELRERLFYLGYEFSRLDESTKNKYIHPESFYNFGWSHGKEKFLDIPDVQKGSFYANPILDIPPASENERALHPSFLCPNIWPTDDLPLFEDAFKSLGKLIIDVGKLVALQCDNYVKLKCASYRENILYNTVTSSTCCKARLLNYFPMATKDFWEESVLGEENTSDWCGWHNDHGSLTGLCAGMYFNQEGHDISSPDPLSGLYVKPRNGPVTRVSFPADHLAFQIGETAQINSGGILQATPHAVRGARASGVSRVSFAVFMEPMWHTAMTSPPDVPIDVIQSSVTAASLPSMVPPLAARWSPDMTFSDFTTRTLSAYH